jgi:hypothetical protein
LLCRLKGAEALKREGATVGTAVGLTVGVEVGALDGSFDGENVGI